jgi:hypothetical protein
VKRFKSHHWFGYFFDNRRAILPHEILGTPVANALNKIRSASDADVFRRAPAMKLQQYAKETLAPFGLKPL